MTKENIEVRELTVKGITNSELPENFKEKNVYVFDEDEDAFDTDFENNNHVLFENAKNKIVNNDKYVSFVYKNGIVYFYEK